MREILTESVGVGLVRASAWGGRYPLSVILIAAAVAKLFSLHQGTWDLFATLMALAELAAAGVLLVGCHVKKALVFVVALAVGGAYQAFSTSQPCGCFGSLAPVSWKAHAGICCLMGIMVAIGWPSMSRSVDSNRLEETWPSS